MSMDTRPPNTQSPERTNPSGPTDSGPRDTWVVVVLAISLFAAVTGIIAAGWAARSMSDDGASTVGAAASGAGTEVVQVELGEFYVLPAAIDVAPGTEVIVEVTNAGMMPHDLKLGGETGTAILAPGESETVSLGVVNESSQAWCTVPGHRQAGMMMDINVIGGAPGGQGAHGANNAATGTATGAQIDFNAAPAPDWKPFDPTLEPAAGGTEHQLTFSMGETELEIAPGVTQQLWTFNGQTPGPILRGKVGDIFTVTVVNDGDIGHSLDFHASKVAWDDEMRTLQPGESLVYQFEAKHAGAFMYHCGTAPTLHHIGNGMHGAIIIDPPDLAPADREFIFVQHEFYTGEQGEPGDLAKMQRDSWDAVVFNGYVNQYVHAPIRTEPGERIRAWVVNNGPSENSSFHVVGTVFDTVYKEGAYQLRPDATSGGAQALDLQPAQGGFVEFTFDEVGAYPFVTHKFSSAGKGATGFFHAGEVSTAAAGH